MSLLHPDPWDPWWWWFALAANCVAVGVVTFFVVFKVTTFILGWFL